MNDDKVCRMAPLPVKEEAPEAAPVDQQNEAGEAFSMPPMERGYILTIRPGDVLVLETSEPLSVVCKSILQEQIERRFPSHKCLVLESGLSLTIARDMDPVVYEVDVPQKAAGDTCEGRR